MEQGLEQVDPPKATQATQATQDGSTHFAQQSRHKAACSALPSLACSLGTLNARCNLRPAPLSSHWVHRGRQGKTHTFPIWPLVDSHLDSTRLDWLPWFPDLPLLPESSLSIPPSSIDPTTTPRPNQTLVLHSASSLCLYTPTSHDLAPTPLAPNLGTLIDDTDTDTDTAHHVGQKERRLRHPYARLCHA